MKLCLCHSGLRLGFTVVEEFIVTGVGRDINENPQFTWRKIWRLGAGNDSVGSIEVAEVARLFAGISYVNL